MSSLPGGWLRQKAAVTGNQGYGTISEAEEIKPKSTRPTYTASDDWPKPMSSACRIKEVCPPAPILV
jgi:hypothetical protein